MNSDVNNGRTIASILADTKEELKQFLATRVSLFRAELAEKGKRVKRAAPVAVAAVVLLITAYVLFTLALVALVFALLPAGAFTWFFAFFAVAVLWSILGVAALSYAKRALSLKELRPDKTIGVLKTDGVWIESEVKHQI